MGHRHNLLVVPALECSAAVVVLVDLRIDHHRGREESRHDDAWIQAGYGHAWSRESYPSRRSGTLTRRP